MQDHHELEIIVQEVRTAILSIEAEPSRNLKTLFPAMWCEYASIIIAEVLRKRGLGDWTLVDAGRPDFPNGHAWLELRDEGGVRQATIDATIDQFPWGGDGPFVSDEQTPAANVFSEPRYEGPWEEWPVLAYNPSYRAYSEAFAEQSGLFAEESAQIAPTVSSELTQRVAPTINPAVWVQGR